ncbi:unnamed protein product [Cylindrotheca closterium]|uniref:Helicase ATP-binding domain-containing protein n=1 Tax=Cylindrotheca closterium TaxID=2856 RepID=A0AAD2CYU4_9STRA|nr:unnamed protein product [Cylindrotheca closterium]
MAEYPRGATVPFPRKPYPQQVALMDTLLEAIAEPLAAVNETSKSSVKSNSPTSVLANLKNDNKDDNDDEKKFESETKIVLLESPTGTGKSLSLACASLAWLEYQKRKTKNQTSETSSTTPIHDTKLGEKTGIESSKVPTTIQTPVGAAAAAKKESSSTGLDWIDSWQPDENDDLELQRQLEQQKRQQQVENDRLEQLQKEVQKIRQSFSQEDEDATLQQNRRVQLLKQAITKSKIQARKKQRLQRRRKKQPLEWEDDEDDEKNDFQYKNPDGSIPWMLEPPVSISSADNSSSTPIRPKIIYAARTHSQLSQFVSEVRKTHWGNSTKVIALASRSQGMCGYLTSSGNRGFAKRESDLTEACLELRQSKKRSTNSVSSCACPHYHPDAIATLALHALAHPTDVEDWREMGKATQTCSYYASRQALVHADLVVLPYSLLVAKETRDSIGLTLEGSLVLVDEAHNLPQAIANLQSCTLTATTLEGASHQVNSYTKEYMDRLSPRHLQLLGQLKQLLRGFQECLGSSSSDKNSYGRIAGDSGGTSKELLSPLQFLCRYKLDRINIFPLLRYMEETKLSQKLLGFVPTVEDGDDAKDGDDNAGPGLFHRDSDKAIEEVKRKKKKKKTTRLSPIAVVESFLSKLNYANADGKIVICPNEHKIQFVVLNPAVASEDDLYHRPRALCLVGGTLQPMDVMIQELVPDLSQVACDAQRAISNGNSGFKSDKLVAFSCGHVVPKSNVLLQAITKVDGVPLDIRHKSRSLPEVMNAIGKSILRLAKQVPNGMVVFTGSYRYEQALVDFWKTKAPHIWKELNSTKRLFREPKDSKQTDEVLTSFSDAASSDRRGALLFSVMGGKLSEGINFANELCRCVVVIGLPYPDAKDPLLQEKLKLLPASADGGSSGGFSYLRSLCLRSVNQSVGRAIRHANDYAGIVLMDVRYTQDDAIGRGLPKWLTESTPEWKRQDTTLSSAERRLEEFFQFHTSVSEQ